MLIVVLNDGETYTGLDGCCIMDITPEGIEKLDEGQDPNDLEPSDILSSIKLTLLGR